QEQRISNSRFKCTWGRIALDHQVFVNIFSRIAVVGVDSANLCRRKDDRMRLFGFDELLHSGPVQQVQLGARPDERFYAPRLQLADDGRTDHAAVPGNVNSHGELNLPSRRSNYSRARSAKRGGGPRRDRSPSSTRTFLGPSFPVSSPAFRGPPTRRR